MANNVGTLVIQPIRPQSEEDTFPSAIANEIKGGFHVQQTVQDRNNIPIDRREIGMLCYVISTDTIYQLKDGITNEYWSTLSIGGEIEPGNYLTKEDADQLYAVLNHRHDTLYQPISHTHPWSDLRLNEYNKLSGSKLQHIEDVPTYLQNQNKFLRVNAQGTGVEWANISIGLKDLNDAPPNVYEETSPGSGTLVNAGKFLRIRTDNVPGWELVDINITGLEDKQDDLLKFYGIDPNTILTSAEFNQPNGVAQLDQNAKLPQSIIPASMLTSIVVNTYNELQDIENPYEGQRQFVLDTNKEYIYTGTEWHEIIQTINMVLNWNDINGKPTSLPNQIDDAVTKRHSHGNLQVLNATEMPFTIQLQTKLSSIEIGAISKSTQDSLYKPISWTPSMSDISNVSISNIANNQQLVWDITQQKFVNKTIFLKSQLDQDNDGIVDRAKVQDNTQHFDSKQPSYFQKNIYKSVDDPSLGYIIEENDLWIDTSDSTNYTLKIYKNGQWQNVTNPINISLFDYIDNTTIISDNGIIKVNMPQITINRSQITDFQHTHNPNDINISTNYQFVRQSEKDYWNAKQDKNGQLQTNLNADLLRGQALNDSSPQAPNILWSSHKITNVFSNLAINVVWKDEIIDIINSPISNPEVNSKYIIGENPTGIFISYANYIQVYDGNDWQFIQPDTNEQRFVIQQNTTYLYNGEHWIKLLVSINEHNLLNGLQGGNADTEEFYHLTYTQYDKILNGYNTDDISEGVTNQYFTIDRQRNTLNQTQPIQYNTSTGTISILPATQAQDGYLTKEDKQKLDYINIGTPSNNFQLMWDATQNKYTPKNINTQIQLTFLNLTDTPTTYVGNNNKFVVVDELNNKLKFTALSLSMIPEFSNFTEDDIRNQLLQQHSHSDAVWNILSDLEINYDTMKTKLNSIEYGANKYTHPATHPASIIVTTPEMRFVTDYQIQTWNAKQDQLGYIPENIQNRGIPNGYASLDGSGYVPVTQIPPSVRSVTVVQNIAERNAIQTKFDGLRVFVVDQYDDTGNHESVEYIWSSSQSTWIRVSQTYSVELTWTNITGKPQSTPQQIDDQVSKRHTHNSTIADIDDQVTKRHTHNNKSVLDQIPSHSGVKDKILYVDNTGTIIWKTQGLGTKQIDESNIRNGYALVYNSTVDKIVYAPIVTSWETLDKTNSSVADLSDVERYSSHQNELVMVNSTQTGYTYTNVIDGGTW